MDSLARLPGYARPPSDAGYASRMTGPDDSRRPSRLRFIVKEGTILAVGLVVLFIVLGVVFSFLSGLMGWSMCCQ